MKHETAGDIHFSDSESARLARLRMSASKDVFWKSSERRAWIVLISQYGPAGCSGKRSPTH